MSSNFSISLYLRYLLAIILIFGLILISCSNSSKSAGSEDVEIGRVIASDVIYNLEDFTVASIKFKKLREYDVDQLPYAKSVFFGFKKFDDPIDFEMRFFDSHQEALLGVELVRERAGTPEEIKLDKDEAVFTEGLKDVRECVGSGSQRGMGGDTSGGAGVGGHCLNSKYKNYIVQGNLILLCSGMDSKDSMINCEKLLALLSE